MCVICVVLLPRPALSPYLFSFSFFLFRGLGRFTLDPLWKQPFLSLFMCFCSLRVLVGRSFTLVETNPLIFATLSDIAFRAFFSFGNVQRGSGRARPDLDVGRERKRERERREREEGDKREREHVGRRDIFCESLIRRTPRERV